MNIRSFGILVFCMSVLLFFVMIAVALKTKRRQKKTMEDLIFGYNRVSQAAQDDADYLSSGPLSGYAHKLDEMLAEIYEEKTTSQSIIKTQIMSFFSGLAIGVIAYLVTHSFLMVLIVMGLTGIITYLPYGEVMSEVQKKREQFDRALPAFETNLLLGLQAGANPVKSMEMALQSLNDEYVQIEFKQLLRDIQLNTDNLAKPYMELSRRVKTKDCERFCAIIITGVKNGNTMSEILSQEAEIMNLQLLNRIQEMGQKNSIKATAISSGMIFLPLIIIFVAPLMSNSM